MERKELLTGKIVFIDDQPGTVESFIQYLHSEGYTNTVLMSQVSSLNHVLAQKADLIFLDLGGIATSIAAKDEGLAVLRFVKSKAPWIRVVVLSASSFTVEKSPDIAKADLCVTKASLNLADLLEIVENQLRFSLAPEFRNAQIFRFLGQEIDDLNLGFFAKRKVKGLIHDAILNEGNIAWDWPKAVGKAKSLLTTSAEVATIIGLFI